MIHEIYTSIMRNFEPKPTQPIRTGLSPRECLLQALLISDEPVPVPVDWALKNLFDDVYIGEFCAQFHLRYTLVDYPGCERQFFEFEFRTEESDEEEIISRELNLVEDDYL